MSDSGTPREWRSEHKDENDDSGDEGRADEQLAMQHAMDAARAPTRTRKRKRNRAPDAEEQVKDEGENISIDASVDLDRNSRDLESESGAELELDLTAPERRTRAHRAPPDDAFAPHELAGLVANMAPVGGIDPLDVVDDPGPQPVPRQSVNWDLYVQDVDDPITQPDFCLWSIIAQSKQQYKTNQRFAMLTRMHKENYGRMQPFAFVRMMQNFYNKEIRFNIRLPSIDDPTIFIKWANPPPWPARRIWNYVLTDVVLPSAVREDVARTMQQVLRTLADSQMFLRDSTGRQSIDLKVLDAYNKTWDKSRALFDKLESSRNTSLFSL